MVHTGLSVLLWRLVGSYTHFGAEGHTRNPILIFNLVGSLAIANGLAQLVGTGLRGGGCQLVKGNVRLAQVRHVNLILDAFSCAVAHILGRAVGHVMGWFDVEVLLIVRRLVDLVLDVILGRMLQDSLDLLHGELGILLGADTSVTTATIGVVSILEFVRQDPVMLSLVDDS